MKHFKWNYFAESSNLSKDGEKLWYVDLNVPCDYEMEIQKSDDDPYILLLYKTPEPDGKPYKRIKFKSLEAAKAAGLQWLFDGLTKKWKQVAETRDKIATAREVLAEAVLTEQLKSATKE